MGDGRYTDDQIDRLGIPEAIDPAVYLAAHWLAVAKEMGVPVTEMPRLVHEEPAFVEAVAVLMDGRNRPDPSKPNG